MAGAPFPGKAATQRDQSLCLFSQSCKRTHVVCVGVGYLLGPRDKFLVSGVVGKRDSSSWELLSGWECENHVRFV